MMGVVRELPPNRLQLARLSEVALIFRFNPTVLSNTTSSSKLRPRRFARVLEHPVVFHCS